MEASGRRLLLLCGFGICCAACVLLTVALNFQVPRETFSVIHSLNMLLCYPLVGQHTIFFMSEFLRRSGDLFWTLSHRGFLKTDVLFVYFLEED